MMEKDLPIQPEISLTMPREKYSKLESYERLADISHQWLERISSELKMVIIYMSNPLQVGEGRPSKGSPRQVVAIYRKDNSRA